MGFKYYAIIGTKLPLDKLHPYIFNYQELWGLGFGFTFSGYGKLDIFYIRLQHSPSTSQDFEFENAVGSNLSYFDDLLNDGDNGGRTTAQELYAGKLSLNLEDIPIVNLLRLPGDMGLGEVSQVDLFGVIIKEANYATGVENTFNGASNDITRPKTAWKIKVTSPFAVHTNAGFITNTNGALTFNTNLGARIYGMKVTMRLINELTNRVYISGLESDKVAADRIINIEGGNANLSGTFNEVSPESEIIYTIKLTNLPDIEDGIEIDSRLLDKAEVELEIDNNYIVQLVSSTDTNATSFTEYGVIPFNGDAYPLDVVAVSKKKVSDGSNRKKLTISLGTLASKRLYGIALKGRALTIDYNYSFLVQELYSRIDSASQSADFQSFSAYVQTLSLERGFLDESLFWKFSYYYVDPGFNYLWKDGRQLIIDDDDNDTVLNERFELPRAADLNENAILDWKESFIIKNVTPLLFAADEDANHNFVEDQEEDDEKPETPYGFNIEGYKTAVVYRVPRTDILVSAGLSLQQRLTSGQVNSDNYMAITYDSKRDRGTILGKIKVKNSLHFIKDEILDEVRDIKLTSRTTESRKDYLLFRDSIRNRLIFSQKKVVSKYISVENNLAVDQNFAFYNETNTYTRSLILSKINFTIPLAEKVAKIVNNLVFVKEIDSNNNDPNGVFNKDNNNLYFISALELFPANNGREAINLGLQFQKSFSAIDEVKNFEEISYILQVKLGGRGDYEGVISYVERKLLYELPLNVNEKNNSISFKVKVYQ